ncbi:hypothetical protein F6R98_09345 [Candidatus Methylospira mobilis]|uniref:Uncharacterized protein n=1 Tax=Candidatus Methylospira mobilis TaxID=1808979 RepID=A0A5Q0BGY6_9GAMM|nr:hypothetical protein [Candidatus Methylospira mobilis]QFY42799.1 hypothetical protein F6R98_09345 [Candidatus Methylospira mobilis]WNV03690.1 hypothetical protein RP726_14735 [Candidatus Methylospira mobilis]
MSKLRDRLQEEINKRGWTTSDLEKASRVPSTITDRFLSGKQGDPLGDAVERWAYGLGITETSLRGFDDPESTSESAAPPFDFNAYEVARLGRYRNAVAKTQAAVDLLLLPDAERNLLREDTLAAIILLEAEAALERGSNQ